MWWEKREEWVRQKADLNFESIASKVIPKKLDPYGFRFCFIVGGVSICIASANKVGSLHLV